MEDKQFDEMMGIIWGLTGLLAHTNEKLLDRTNYLQALLDEHGIQYAPSKYRVEGVANAFITMRKNHKTECKDGLKTLFQVLGLGDPDILTSRQVAD